jgi:hypothetical protein
MIIRCSKWSLNHHLLDLHDQGFQPSCYNHDMELTTKCGVQEHMRPRKCVWEWNKLSQVGEGEKEWAPMTPKCTLTLGIAHVQESRIFKSLIKKANMHQFGPQDTIEKVFKCKYLKCTCTICLDLKCTNYNQKKTWESNWGFDS